MLHLVCMKQAQRTASRADALQPACGRDVSPAPIERLLEHCVCGGQAGVERAAKLVGRLAYNRTIKDSVRDARGLNALLALLPMERNRQVDPRLGETVMVALTILAVNNELNQDAIRWLALCHVQGSTLGLDVDISQALTSCPIGDE